jgi:hypothetical protein
MAVQFDNLGDVKPKVTAGGQDKTKSVPNLNVSFFDDEFYLNLNRKDKIITNEKAATASGKTSLGGIDTDIWYIDDKGRFKWDIEFTSRPAVNSWTWELKHTKGIEFYHQPALTAEEIADGCIRPDEVVGSYAVYCNKANNKYKTGKLCHIYRPFCYDAKGNTIYADLQITDGQLTITIDTKWLDSAAYPVRLDPTLGYTTAGASNTTAVGLRINNNDYIPANDGTVDDVKVYAHVNASGSHTLNAGYYENSSGNPGTAHKAAITVSNTDPAWVSATLSGDLTASAEYYPAVAQASGTPTLRLYYDSGGARWTSASYTDLVDNPSGLSSGSYLFSVYIDYTESGGSTGNSYYYQQQQM